MKRINTIDYLLKIVVTRSIRNTSQVENYSLFATLFQCISMCCVAIVKYCNCKALQLKSIAIEKYCNCKALEKIEHCNCKSIASKAIVKHCNCKILQMPSSTIVKHCNCRTL